MAQVHASLRAADIPLDLFDTIVSADAFERLKPAPDIFLAAAAQLGVPPTNCVVIEDAVAGVQAARSAGGCTAQHSILSGIAAKKRQLCTLLRAAHLTNRPALMAASCSPAMHAICCLGTAGCCCAGMRVLGVTTTLSEAAMTAVAPDCILPHISRISVGDLTSLPYTQQQQQGGEPAEGGNHASNGSSSSAATSQVHP